MTYKNEDFDWMLKEENQEFFKKINPFLNIINKNLILKRKTTWKPPIFITGPPRCGSTVVSQIVAEALDVGFISNFIAKFWMAPYIGAYLWKQFGLKRSISFKSLRASTKSLGDLNEFNFFWNRYFDDSHSHYCEKLDDEKIKELRLDIESITYVFEKNVLFKYVLGAYKFSVLKEVIPDLKVLVINRDPLYIAQSLLKIRRQVYGNIDEWWSLKPREIDSLRELDPYDQVVGQAYYTYQELESKAKKNPEDFLYVEYEDIINNTEDELKRIANKFDLKFRDEYSLPDDKLTISKTKFIEESEFEKIEHYVQKYFG
jgi:hypothetical protein